MAGAVEKGNNPGLFENEIEFNGKYAFQIRYLKDDLHLFGTFREAYVTSAAIGYMFNKTETADDNEKYQEASIFSNELKKRGRDLKFLYRLIMLTKDESEFCDDDYINRTFKDDAEGGDLSKLRENIAVFNSYACGGLEFLYDKFKDVTSEEDKVSILYELMHPILSELYLVEEDNVLEDFYPTI